MLYESQPFAVSNCGMHTPCAVRSHVFLKRAFSQRRVNPVTLRWQLHCHPCFPSTSGSRMARNLRAPGPDRCPPPTANRDSLQNRLIPPSCTPPKSLTMTPLLCYHGRSLCFSQLVSDNGQRITREKRRQRSCGEISRDVFALFLSLYCRGSHRRKIQKSLLPERTSSLAQDCSFLIGSSYRLDMILRRNTP